MSTLEERTQRWLDWLRDGSEADKIAARRGLARVFEERGMLDEAIELLERNVEAGAHGAETLRRLSHLYQARDAGENHSDLDDPEARLGWSPRVSVLPAAMELQAQPLHPRAIRELVPYLAMMVGLGITLGTALWLLMPA